MRLGCQIQQVTFMELKWDRMVSTDALTICGQLLSDCYTCGRLI